MAEKPITIAVLAGATRPERRSIHAARYVAEFGRQLPDVEIVFVDPAELTFPPDDHDSDPRYAEITVRADAFFIVTPEYNHGYPSSLKRMLDSQFETYHRKPVALGGASDGNWGGTRAVEALLPVLRTLGLLTVAPTAYFPRVQDTFDATTGAIAPDQQARVDRMIDGVYRELIWTARALKAAREATQ